jgi:hypothetical protein
MAKEFLSVRGLFGVALVWLCLLSSASGQANTNRILLKCDVVDSKMIEVLEVTSVWFHDPGVISVYWRTSQTAHTGRLDERYIVFEPVSVRNETYRWTIDRNTGAMSRSGQGTISAVCKPLIGEPDIKLR